MKKPTAKKLFLVPQTVRILSGMELQDAIGGTIVPAQTQSSTAESCRTTRFNCCA